jgi:hypothetical protein
MGVAEKLRRTPIDEKTVYSKPVVLTGEPGALATPNGRWCFLDALALLPRIVGQLLVVLPDECTFRQEVRDRCARTWTRGSVVVDAGPDQYKDARAILNVGSTVRTDLPWTTVNSNGWVARVSSHGALPRKTERANAPAALLAASFGVTEVFKRIYEIPAEVAPLLDLTAFSLYDLTTNPSDIGPELPRRIILPDTLLTGAGAIGNAIAWLLSQLPIEGRLHIIDRQCYGDENLGTCLLLDAIGWVDQPKAERMAEWLQNHSRLKVTGERIEIERAIERKRFGGLSIDLILNGLDDPDPRRHTQRLWPSIVVDGGINEVGAAVIQHRSSCSEACLSCWFEPPEIDAVALQSRWTGLRAETLRDAVRPLKDEDIAAAAPEKQSWLRERQREGKTICSIMTEAQLAQRLGVQADGSFRPSAPFVASAAAALVIAASLKALIFQEAPSPSIFQFGNLFLGPEASAGATRNPTPGCQCVSQRAAIARLQSARRDLGADR